MKAGGSKKVIELLMAMYKNTYCRVKLNRKLSKEFLYSIGVHQGCVLSPLLFSLVINDIAELLKKENCGTSIGDALIYILLYPNDIVLVADSEIHLQDMVDKLKTYWDQSMMKRNTSKTQWVVFE